MPESLSIRSSLLVLLSLLVFLLSLTGGMGLYASTRVITSLVYHGIVSIAMLAAIALLAVIWFMLRNKFLEPLDTTVEQLERLAMGGLSPITALSAGAEFNRLNAAVDDMRHTLDNSVQRVRDISSQIDIGSRKLTTRNQHLAQRTESTITSLGQTTTSVEELTATMKQNAQNTEQTHQLVESVSDAADRGSEIMCYVIEKMRDISGNSSRIADILSVIGGIASQTNILAFNASVEAVRTGEQGWGFAVVAGEVRNLTDRSAEAAKETRMLISDSHTHVGEGSELTQQADETMDEIVTEVTCMTKLMHEVASTSQEQSHDIEQVNIAVIQMGETAQQNTALVQQSSAATRSLEEQSSALIEAMAVFKLRRA